MSIDEKPNRIMPWLLLILIVLASMGVGYLLGQQQNPAPIVIETAS